MSQHEAKLQERHHRFEQLKTQRAILAELQDVKLLLLEIGKSLIDIQALIHPAALLNTLLHIKERAAGEEGHSEPQTPNGTERKHRESD